MPDDDETTADDHEGEDEDHDVPGDLTELHEVLEWAEATKAAE